MEKRMSAGEIIETLRLEPLEVEGGMFASTYQSPGMAGAKHMGSAIYFLLSGGAYSHLHRLPTDELYHFYMGDPVEMLTLLPDGSSEVRLLGPDLAAGQRPQIVVPANCWHGSRLLPGGQYALLGTTMSPGFAPGDYEHASREALLAAYPGQAHLIEALTGPVCYQ